MTHRGVTRRRLLAALSAASVSGLAGCSDFGVRSSPASGPSSTTATSTPAYTVDTFVERDGTALQVDGQPYRYNGMMGLLTHTQLGKEWTDTTMAVAEEYDIDAFRCWGFPAPWDDVPDPHQAPGAFDDEWFSLFDYTVAKAKQAGVRLVVPLLQGVHVDSERTSDLAAPSPVAYGSWSDTADYTRYTRAFIEDDQANEYFKEYIEHFLTRENQYTGLEYREEPTILMWECANELEYKHPDRAGQSMAAWYDDIASYIKSLDSNHLVSTGMHGSMGEIYEPWTERCAFVEDHRVDAIDVCSFHAYPVYEFRDTVRFRSKELAGRYAEHKIDLAHDEVGKPVYGGEYGVDFAPDVDQVYMTTLETPEEASDVTDNAEYPLAYPDQHDDGVLVTRVRDDVDGPTLATRAAYFRDLTDVAAAAGLDGIQFWRLGPAPNTEMSDADARQFRAEENPRLVYPTDDETLAAVREHHEAIDG